MPVTLRPLERCDAAQVFAWRNSDAVARYMYGDHVIRPVEHRRSSRRMIPNLKRIGLLTDAIRPQFEALGVLQFENLRHDGQIDWATLEAPLRRGEEVVAV